MSLGLILSLPVVASLVQDPRLVEEACSDGARLLDLSAALRSGSWPFGASQQERWSLHATS